MIPLAIILALHIRLVVVRPATDAVALLLLVFKHRSAVVGNRLRADLAAKLLARDRIFLLWNGWRREVRISRVDGFDELRIGIQVLRHRVLQVAFRVLLRQDPLDFVSLHAHVTLGENSLNLIHFRVILVVYRVNGADASIVAHFGEVFREKCSLILVSLYLLGFGDDFFYLAH